MPREVFIKSRKMPDWLCPGCRRLVNGCTGVSDSPEGTIPRLGALSICAYCGTVAEIGEQGLVPASRAKFETLHPDLQRVTAAMLERAIGHGPVFLGDPIPGTAQEAAR